MGNKNRYRDIPWLPRLSFLSSRGDDFGRSRRTGTLSADRGEEEPQERFETLGVSEGDSLDVKKVTSKTNNVPDIARVHSKTKHMVFRSIPPVLDKNLPPTENMLTMIETLSNMYAGATTQRDCRLLSFLPSIVHRVDVAGLTADSMSVVCLHV